MHNTREQEFKTVISKKQYEELLKKYDLENNIYKQTNYYFDTDDFKLNNEHTILRIRQKGTQYKLTKKERGKEDHEAYESHVFLQEYQALDYLKNGFDATIIDLHYKVKYICELTTYRCKTAYLDGTLFFDKSEYYGNTDYEIEYEVDSIEQGTKDFNLFLKENKIEYKPTKRKSTRAFEFANKK